MVSNEHNCAKALLLLFLLFLVSSAPSRALHSEPIFSRSPTPSPTPDAAASRAATPLALRRVLLGALLGSFAGIAAGAAFLYLLRLFLLFAHRAPILKGPVIFFPSVSPRTLQLALSDDAQPPPQLLGSSPSGKYYKLILDDELPLAAKQLEPSHHCDRDGSSPGAPSSNSHIRRVQRELERLARVKHRNVMSLRAYVRGRSRFTLVYDYMPGGSLEDAMGKVRSQEITLGWDVRHRIAVGIAKGLRYLHFECLPKILHYRLRPSNVMLDEGFEPRLGDAGLATLIPPCLDAPGAADYVAPECFQSCRYTDKSDVYSFGVILAVLLTGKDPLDPFFVGEAGRGSLSRWLRHLQQAGEAQEALDKNSMGEEVEEEMLMAIRIALVCQSDLPADRPSSDELVAMLTQLHSF